MHNVHQLQEQQGPSLQPDAGVCLGAPPVQPQLIQTPPEGEDHDGEIGTEKLIFARVA